MASSSKQKFSEPEAQKMADDWEARIRRLVNDDDQEAFKNDQRVLYEKLVITNTALLLYAGDARLCDYLVPVFNEGQTKGPNGKPILNADFGKVKKVISKFDKKISRKRNEEGDTAGKKAVDADEGGARGGTVPKAAGRIRNSEDRIEDQREGSLKGGKGRDVEEEADEQARKDKEEKQRAKEKAKEKEEAQKENEKAKKVKEEKAEKARREDEKAEKARREEEKAEKARREEKAEKAEKLKREKAEKARREKEEKARKDREDKARKEEEDKAKNARKKDEERKDREREMNEVPAKKRLRHKEGGRMSVPRRKVKYPSNSTVATSEEEIVVTPKRPRIQLEDDDFEEEYAEQSKSKGKRRAVSPGNEGRVLERKKVAQVEGSDGDDSDEKSDEEGRDDEGDSTRPLKVAQKRAAEKAAAKRAAQAPPDEWYPVPEKCSMCASKNIDCLWRDGAGKKEGPKACWMCRVRKIACHNGFKKEGPVVVELNKISPFLVDLGTPLNDLSKRLAPPPADIDGTPRSGIAGENPEVPNTLGELLVDLAITIRETKEENKELKKELKEVKRTLQTMVAYEGKKHAEVMEVLKVISAKIQPPQVGPAGSASRPEDGSPIMRHAEATTAPRPSPVVLPPVLMPSRVALNLDESDKEDIASPHMDEGPSSASRMLRDPIPPNNAEDELNGDENEPPIPSVVADRTRNKKKAAESIEPPADNVSGSEHSNEEEEVKIRRGQKRKVAGKGDGDGEDETIPRKKSRVPAGKTKTATKAAGN